ncbi:hypothetical protein KP509_15G048600 [Ceratopteris richardii]|uniref:C2 domain-containing protein n=1 Tax=Ceratopteris richardii TaxID=49495 RepID=A0A8T2T4T2_CERRI|nr:hypothetical protein KP509_15G048600 [Ceratopteris richardii]KAH7404886.1 hypothetical protein KP509_15G048600 [Ceratopteris richardii]
MPLRTSDIRGEELADSVSLSVLLSLLCVVWILQRFFLPFLYTWWPFLAAAWTAFEYGRHKHKMLLGDLSNKWKRHMLYTSPETPLEPCEWLNKLIANLWPNYMEPRLSQIFSVAMMKQLKGRKTRPFRTIDLQEFFLGISPPILAMQKTFWSSKLDEQVFHMGFEWETSDMKVLLAGKLAGGTARFVINSLYAKGDIMVILDGQALLYSFTSCPEIRIGMAFGSGGQSVPATELPLIASWLEKLFKETLVRTMVEPQRRCFPLPAVSLKKHVSGAVFCITVISARNLKQQRHFATVLSGTSSRSESGIVSEDSLPRTITSFVEITLGGLTRRTGLSEHYGSPKWNDTFNMILHGSEGTICFNIYEQTSSHVKGDFCGSCKIQVKYAADGSTIFWTSGVEDQVLADRAENCWKEVLMNVPISGIENAELCVSLIVTEWQFVDGSRIRSDTFNKMPSKLLYSFGSLETITGRTLRITVVEGRNLAAKDRTGKSDPYVQLRYGKVKRKTKTVKGDLNPVWKQTYEFPELHDVDHLQLKCFDADYITDENLGTARVNLDGLEDGVVRDIWIPLQKVKTGEIHLLLEAFTIDTEAETPQVDQINSLKDCQRDVLEVVLLEARDLVAADVRGTSDPFVVLQCGDEKRISKVVNMTLHPQWNQTFELNDTGEPLRLTVMDHNVLLPNVKIGHCTVEYDRIPRNQVIDKWVPLQGVRNGELHVQVIRKPAESGISKKEHSNRTSKALDKSHKVQALLKQLAIMSKTGADTETLEKKLEELKILEAEKSLYLTRLLKEREMLLGKIQGLAKMLEINEEHS